MFLSQQLHIIQLCLANPSPLSLCKWNQSQVNILTGFPKTKQKEEEVNLSTVFYLQLQQTDRSYFDNRQTRHEGWTISQTQKWEEKGGRGKLSLASSSPLGGGGRNREGKGTLLKERERRQLRRGRKSPLQLSQNQERKKEKAQSEGPLARSVTLRLLTG